MNKLDSCCRFYGSSIGKKIIVALTGGLLFLFLIGHLAGNLLMYAGPGAMNAYAEFLKSALHGWGVWIARIVLLVSVVLHIATTLQLARQNRAARSQRYGVETSVQTSLSARIMVISGLTILCFVLYHLAHFTVHFANDYGSYVDGEGRHDVYRMVVEGFSWLPATIFYLVGMILLCSHLGHGVASLFQTLGLATDRNWPLIRIAGRGFALVLFVGFASIPVSVLAGIIR